MAFFRAFLKSYFLCIYFISSIFDKVARNILVKDSKRHKMSDEYAYTRQGSSFMLGRVK